MNRICESYYCNTEFIVEAFRAVILVDGGTLPNHIKFYMSLFSFFVIYLFTITTQITTIGIRAYVSMVGISFENIIKSDESRNFEL